MAFRLFLKHELESRGIDSETYTSYFIGLLDEGSSQVDIQVWLDELSPEQKSENESFSATICDAYSKRNDLSHDFCMTIGGVMANHAEPCREDLNTDSAEPVFTAPTNLASTTEHETIQTDAHIECGDVDFDEILFDEFQHDDASSLEWVSLAFELEDYLGDQNSHYSCDFLLDSIFKSNGDIYFAAALIQKTTERLEECKPCRHLLSSGCFRSDCSFDHDLSLIPCRFWMQPTGCALWNASIDSNHSQISGICSCPFLHAVPDDLVIEILTESSKSDLYRSATEQNPEPDFPDFPELGQPKSSSKNTSQSKAHSSMAYAAIAKKIPTAPAMHSSASTSAWSSRRAASSPAKSNVSFGKRAKASTMSSSPLDWVDSGKSVAVEYKKAREEASRLACARNKLLEEATKAYRAGSKAIAKNLSSEGQALNMQMKECHKQAARAIFAQRNSAATLGRGQIDLHGLHVAEAEACLAELIPTLADDSVVRRLGEVTVVTGSGHHSVGGKAGTPRLLPAVQALLEDMGYSYVMVKDANGWISGVRVRLR